MEKYDEKDGVWRTIMGRRIFIRSGESLGSAMARSGKFKREDIREGKQQLRRIDRTEKTLQKPDDTKLRRKMTNKGNRYERDVFENNQAEKNRINEQAPIFEKGKTRLERNALRYSNIDRQEIKHEYVQKKLADYKAKKQSNNKIQNNNDEFDMRKYTIELQHDKGTKKIDTVASSKESAIKSVLKSENAPDSAVKSVKDNGSILNKQSNNKIEDLKQKALDSKPNLYEQIHNEPTKEEMDYAIAKQSNNKVDKEYHFAGEELYSDDPHRYDDTIKSAQARKEKFKADENFKKEKHIGWGSYNKDGVPVYENDIDYKGDFGWANLKTLSDDDLTKALNVQSEEYHKANAKSVGDGRTRNGRMDRIFKNAEVGKYEQGMKKINEEMQKRNMPRYNIYDKKNPNNILVSSPTKEMADRQIQDMYKTDMTLQKEYGWKELPKYDYRVGKVDENLNEIKEAKKYNKQETIKNYVEKKTKQVKNNNDWLPKATEIKEQGTSNRKEVSDNIQAHILEYYSPDYTGEDISPEKAFVRQMEAMKEPTMWKSGQRIAEGGSYLVYNGDMADFLDSLKINPKGKKFSEDKAFQMYTSLIGRESERLYNKIKKHEQDTINAYKKRKGK